MIDFVIAWVDGNDPDWLKEKAKYEPNIDKIPLALWQS